MSDSKPRLFQRRPLLSAVISGIVVLIFLGGFLGLGIIIGPILAGLLYTSNLPPSENRNNYLSGAKAGLLVSIVPAVPLFLFITFYISIYADSAETTFSWVAPTFGVWVILNAGLGALGAWVKKWQTGRSAR